MFQHPRHSFVPRFLWNCQDPLGDLRGWTSPAFWKTEHDPGCHRNNVLQCGASRAVWQAQQKYAGLFRGAVEKIIGEVAQRLSEIFLSAVSNHELDRTRFVTFEPTDGQTIDRIFG